VEILAAACLLFPLMSLASEVEERFLIMELMDRYGVVHDFGTPEQYADLFTEDGEIGTGKGRPAIVKGRQALIQQARRDHERFGAPPGPDGEFSSIMRHVISNRVVTLTGSSTAEGSSYVVTLINDKELGPQTLSISRYLDKYVKAGGQWKISRREIILEAGNQALGKKYGFVR
jgi:SnoaL-like domain